MCDKISTTRIRSPQRQSRSVIRPRSRAARAGSSPFGSRPSRASFSSLPARTSTAAAWKSGSDAETSRTSPSEISNRIVSPGRVKSRIPLTFSVQSVANAARRSTLRMAPSRSKAVLMRSGLVLLRRDRSRPARAPGARALPRGIRGPRGPSRVRRRPRLPAGRRTRRRRAIRSG